MMLNKKQIFCVLVLTLCIFSQAYAQDEEVQEDSSYTEEETNPLPQSVIAYMSSRAKRYHHYLWHNIRDNWNRLSETAKQQITDLGWAPPRPSREYVNGKTVQILDNNAGEDFFYMHRSMISRFNRLVTENNDTYGKVVGWKTIPAPGDAEYPVPPNYTVPNFPITTSSTITRKTDSFYWNSILPYEESYYDYDFLRNITLGEYGARIEGTVHGYMHMRWSSNSSYGYRPSSSSTIPNVDTKWDDPQYDWLGDSYSSQVHPIFWKIHGWIDDRITDWLLANNLTSYTLKGTWVGGPMSSLSSWTGKSMSMTLSSAKDQDNIDDMDMGDEMDETMPMVMKILLSEVPESSFADDVVVTPIQTSLETDSQTPSVTPLDTDDSKVKRIRKRICKIRSR